MLRSLASVSDVDSLVDLLADYLRCEVTFIVTQDQNDWGSSPPDNVGILQDGSLFWVSIPLFFDRRQMGWLRAAMTEELELGLELLTLAGKLASCILWEQANTQRTWIRLLEGSPVAAEELTAATVALGWPPGVAVGVLAAAAVMPAMSPAAAAAAAGHLGARAGEAWHRCSFRFGGQRSQQPVCFSRNGVLAVFVPMRASEAAAPEAALRSLSLAMQARLSDGTDGGGCVVGIGGWTTELGRLSKLWQDANRAREWGAALQGPGAITDAQSLGVLSLLADYVPAEPLNELCIRVLGPLLEHDMQKGTLLCQTLTAYLDCDGRCAEAAKKLFIHENTLRYRIQRIQEILGMDLSDPCVRVEVFLCLKLIRLAQVSRNS